MNSIIFKDNLDSNQISEILKMLQEKSDSNSALQLGISKAFGCELIKEEVIQEMRDKLYELCEDDDYKSEWD